MKIHPLAIAAAVAVLQFLVFVSLSVFSRAKMPKKGLRPAERNLLVSCAVVLFAWLALVSTASTAAVKASAAPVRTSRGTGSCASIEAGMTKAEVEKLVGKADEVRDDAEIRGPGAATWVYRGSRCAVHLLEDRVEFVE